MAIVLNESKNEPTGPIRASFWPVLALCLITLALFSPSIHFSLVNLDDLAYITENRMIHGGLTLEAVRAAFTSVYQVMWAPVLWISYMVDVTWSGLNPRGFHLANVVLHALNAGLFYFLLMAISGRSRVALLAALLWAMHPLRVESVAWVSARKDVLSGLFFLACLLIYIRAHRSSSITANTRRLVLWLAGPLLMALGLMVKPVLVITPLVLLLLDAGPLHRMTLTGASMRSGWLHLILEKWAYWLLAGAGAAIAMLAHAQGSSLVDLSLIQRISVIPSNYLFYLLKVVYPYPLMILYPSHAFYLPDMLVALGFIFTFTYWFWRYRKVSALPLTGWFWFLVVMLPTSGIVRFGVQSLADRFTYLPAMGISVALLGLLPERGAVSRRTSTDAFIIAAIIAFGILTVRQLPVWRSSEALFDHLSLHQPGHAFALSERAGLRWRQGDIKGALALVDQALTTESRSDVQVVMRGELLAAAGRLEEGIEHLLSSGYASPASSGGIKHFALAMMTLQTGQLEEALGHAEAALQALSPHDLLHREVFLLGMTIHYRRGDQENALRWGGQVLPAYRAKRELSLADLLPYYLGQWRRHQRLEAVVYFRELLQKETGNLGIINNLTWLMATSPYSPMPADEIAGFARKAHELAPENPGVLDTLGVTYAHAGDFESALRYARQAETMLKQGGALTTPLYALVIQRIRLYEQESSWRDENVANVLFKTYLSAP